MSINRSPSFHSLKCEDDQVFLKAQIRVGGLFRQRSEIEMDRVASVRYYNFMAGQRSVEAQLRSANCLVAGDSVETSKRDAERY
jgi:hypothetical protein